MSKSRESKESRESRDAAPSKNSPSPLGSGVGTKASRIGAFGMYPMPIAGSVGAPFFGGKNITEFLDRFEDLCVDYGVTASQKVARVVRYCLPSIRYYLRIIPVFLNSD